MLFVKLQIRAGFWGRKRLSTNLRKQLIGLLCPQQKEATADLQASRVAHISIESDPIDLGVGSSSPAERSL